jgi:phosphoglycolate phosphatase
MQKPLVHLLITDLDNTLYDWVTFFASALYDMVNEAARILDVPENVLLEELREVHQRFGDSEHPFALLETRSVQSRFKGRSRKELAEALDEAFHRFSITRHRLLVLYPGVAETLQRLHDRDVPVIGHTEASAINAAFRLRKLAIARFFTRLYAREPAPQEHPRPPDSTQASDVIDIAYLPSEERKPNPLILHEICRDFRVAPSRTLYVGDSLVRDIGMAKEAGARAAWAEYGTRFESSLWARLVRITHWTPEDVARAEEAKQRYAGVVPDVVLRESFAEILSHFEFQSPTTTS